MYKIFLMGVAALSVLPAMASAQVRTAARGPGVQVQRPAAPPVARPPIVRDTRIVRDIDGDHLARRRAQAQSGPDIRRRVPDARPPHRRPPHRRPHRSSQ